MYWRQNQVISISQNGLKPINSNFNYAPPNELVKNLLYNLPSRPPMQLIANIDIRKMIFLYMFLIQIMSALYPKKNIISLSKEVVIIKFQYMHTGSQQNEIIRPALIGKITPCETFLYKTLSKLCQKIFQRKKYIEFVKNCNIILHILREN